MSLVEVYGSYELNRYGAEVYPIERDRVLGLQALLMTELRPIARTHRSAKMRPPKTTGFVFLQEYEHLDAQQLPKDIEDDERNRRIQELKQRIYDGSTDKYFGVMARRLSPRERRLTVSVLRNCMAPQSRASSTRMIHQFYWRSDLDIALGSKRQVIAGTNRELLMSSLTDDDQLELMQTGEDHREVVTFEPTGNEFDDLEQQVRQTVHALKVSHSGLAD